MKPTEATKHFPKKGERFVNGEWVQPTVELVSRHRQKSHRRSSGRAIAQGAALAAQQAKE